METYSWFRTGYSITNCTEHKGIYAWILGASISKLAEILDCTVQQARLANDNFLKEFPELKKLKEHRVKLDASRGYFIGLDGRKVKCDSEHLMLAGYLQNGEAVAMKKWCWKWYSPSVKLVDIVHDEVQVEVDTEEEAKELIERQRIAMQEVSKELDLFCPLDITSSIGKTWGDTH